MKEDLYNFAIRLQNCTELTKTPTESGYVVYGGENSLKTQFGTYLGWRDLEKIVP